MSEHERIWLEPKGAPDRCWCQDNQWGEDGVEYVRADLAALAQQPLSVPEPVGVIHKDELADLIAGGSGIVVQLESYGRDYIPLFTCAAPTVGG